MDFTIVIFLSSGLFLGWSLGANDAANVFGTAVGSRMVRFTTAAIISSIFIILGAVLSGSGAAHTLGTLGAVNALPGSFMAALSAGLTVYLMTKAGLPVSTGQAIVGAIIGWNLYSGSVTDMNALVKIVLTWVACPVLAALFAAPIYLAVQKYMAYAKLHIVRRDLYTRIGLLFAGAFGAYSLGANNIANVMGVFVPASPFTDFSLGGFEVSGIQQLFLIGALAIGVGVFTYSKRVMMTIGDGIMPLSPIAAWVVVVAQSIVLTLFASEGLEYFLASHNLPTIPLVPVSSSQAVVGAVIGIGLLSGWRNLRWRMLGNISLGWITTPIVAALICYVSLFFLQNVFNQKVYTEVHYTLSAPVLDHLTERGLPVEDLTGLQGRTFDSARSFLDAIGERTFLTGYQQRELLTIAEAAHLYVSPELVESPEFDWLGEDALAALRQLSGQRFATKWALAEALAELDEHWRPRPDTIINKTYNKDLQARLDFLYRAFDVSR